MASQQEQRREANREKARQRIARPSTDLEIKQRNVSEIEAKEAMIYIDVNKFKDACQKVSDKMMLAYLPYNAQILGNSYSKWNEAEKSKNLRAYVQPRNRVKQILALYIYTKEQLESKMFTDKYKECEDEKAQRDQKLTLSTEELLDFSFQEKYEFKKACEYFLSLSAKEFLNHFSPVTIGTKEKYVADVYIERQEWYLKDGGEKNFKVGIKYHTHNSDLRVALSKISFFLHNRCGNDFKNVLNQVQFRSMSEVLQNEKFELSKKEREEEKEKREANEKTSGSSDQFSFLPDKDNAKEKKKRPGNEKEAESKRSRSEPAERKASEANIIPEDGKMED